MGLLSDGGVHSSLEHLFKLCDISAAYGLENTFVHCFMDGRDVPPASGAGYMAELVDYLERAASKAPAGAPCEISIASVEGRYYAMDRDNRWERVERAYDAVVCAEPFRDLAAVAAMEASYGSEVTDEFVEPVAWMPAVCATGMPSSSSTSARPRPRDHPRHHRSGLRRL